MKSALVVGGSGVVGTELTRKLLADYEKVIIADKVPPRIKDPKIQFIKVDFTDCDYEVFESMKDIDALVITIGFGRVALFKDMLQKEIENSFKVNAAAVIRLIRIYYEKLLSDKDFKCVVMGSIAGWVSSPLFAVYSATKAALCRFIESVNIELEMAGTKNRILNVSPGVIKGTSFSGGKSEPELLSDLCDQIICKMNQGLCLFIPNEEVYGGVIERYNADPREYGIHSYNYKINNGRLNTEPQVKVGYLSGTFDLFHIGHLNLLRRAKEKCDYLIVGVHQNGTWKGKETFIPFTERVEILESIKYVDKVVPSELEDSDAWEKYHYDYLFVGSDYKGSERFKKYEAFFKDKNVEIIYFPYTQGTSSTQLRDALTKKEVVVI